MPHRRDTGSPSMRHQSFASKLVALMIPPDIATPETTTNAVNVLNKDKALLTPTANEASAPAAATVILADDEEFIKPDRDSRLYRRIRLANQLECLGDSTLS
jgi:hypothetical protein